MENNLEKALNDLQDKFNKDIEALTKEAVKRYGVLPLGTKVKGFLGDAIKTMDEKKDYYYDCDGKNIYFGVNGVCLMWNGKWAEIIKEKTLDEVCSELSYTTLEDVKHKLKQNKEVLIKLLNEI